MLKNKLSVIISVSLLSSGTSLASWTGGFGDQDFNDFFKRHFGGQSSRYYDGSSSTFNTHAPAFKTSKNAQLRKDLLGLFKESYEKDFLESLILREDDNNQVLFAQKVLHILRNTDSDSRYDLLNTIYSDYRFKAEDATQLAGKLCGYKKGADRLRVAKVYVEKDLPARINAEEAVRYCSFLNDPQLGKKLYGLFDDLCERASLKSLISREHNIEQRLIFASKLHHILVNTPVTERKDMLKVISDYQFKTADAEALAGKLCGHKKGQDRLRVARDYIQNGIPQRKQKERYDYTKQQKTYESEWERLREELRKAYAESGRQAEMRRQKESAQKEEMRRKQDAERKRAEENRRKREAEEKRKAEQSSKNMTADAVLGRAANLDEKAAFTEFKTIFNATPLKQELLNYNAMREFSEFNNMSNKSKIDAFYSVDMKTDAKHAAARMLLHHFLGYNDVAQDIEQLLNSINDFKAKSGADRFKHVLTIAEKSGLIRGKVSEGSSDKGFYVTIDRIASDNCFDKDKPSIGEEIFVHPNGYNSGDPNLQAPKYIYFNKATRRKFAVGNRVNNSDHGSTTQEYKQARDVKRAD